MGQCKTVRNNLDPKDMEKFNFYRKYYYNFIKSPSRETLMIDLSRKKIRFRFLQYTLAKLNVSENFFIPCARNDFN